MLVDIRDSGLKKIGDLSLREPDRAFDRSKLDGLFSVLGRVENDFAVAHWVRFLQDLSAGFRKPMVRAA
ncbi:hypothetical protein GMO_19320 [Gluconobacter morbifer G707]|uniref:Uncharacterized protein n=1 Tax=Gluconobacter morbifer G707 TaxID=1088869 RepID=G6XKB6_9PROT|nr:hypothetical protein GMO_19320 [Gluconobacter morbifer G707]